MENCVPKCVNVFVGEFTPQLRAVNMFHHEKTQIYVPERTCKNLATRDDGFNCSECNCEVVGCMVDDFGSFDNPLLFSYCPNCGAKVVE